MTSYVIILVFACVRTQTCSGLRHTVPEQCDWVGVKKETSTEWEQKGELKKVKKMELTKHAQRCDFGFRGHYK